VAALGTGLKTGVSATESPIIFNEISGSSIVSVSPSKRNNRSLLTRSRSKVRHIRSTSSSSKELVGLELLKFSAKSEVLGMDKVAVIDSRE
jgi:hypothetical protein